MVSRLAFGIALVAISVTVLPEGAIGEAWHYVISNPPLSISILMAPFAYLLITDFLKNTKGLR